MRAFVPWTPRGPADVLARMTPAQVALMLFMGVVTVLFSLLIAAYGMRVTFNDWRPLPDQWQLAWNTAFLAASCAAMQYASHAARRHRTTAAGNALAAGAALAIAFLAGQLWLWRQLYALDYFVANNPASSFFYLLTGLHGLHLLGGIAALAIVLPATWRRPGAADARTTARIALCTAYWHFLLVIWLVLLAVLVYVTPSYFPVMCGASDPVAFGTP